jgi:hypothetical protein
MPDTAAIGPPLLSGDKLLLADMTDGDIRRSDVVVLLRDARDKVADVGLPGVTAPYASGEVGLVEQAALGRGVRFRQLC